MVSKLGDRDRRVELEIFEAALAFKNPLGCSGRQHREVSVLFDGISRLIITRVKGLLEMGMGQKFFPSQAECGSWENRLVGSIA